MKREEQIAEKVFSYMERCRMLQPGDRVVAGISGGADSVCLLFLLCEYRKTHPFDLSVVHVDHGIRAEAGEDADYVKTLCDELGIPFVLEKADVSALAKKEGLSEEEMGRRVRYEAFEKCAGDGAEPVRIAVAHHMGDRAETLLFHLFRGTGIRGMASIRPVRQQSERIAVIRPLLCLTREEIEEYLAAKELRYCTDRTNYEDAYARNRIRHHILDYAKKEICSASVEHLCRASELMGEAQDFIASEVMKAEKTCVTLSSKTSHPAEILITITAFSELHPFLQKELLSELLGRLSPQKKDIGSVHVESLLGLFSTQSGKQVTLPFGIRAEREYDTIRLYRINKALPEREAGPPEGASKEQQAGLSKEQPEGSSKEQQVVVGARRDETSGSSFIDLSDLGVDTQAEVIFGEDRFVFRRFSYEKSMIIPENQYTKWFDYDIIKDTLFVRSRRPGDYLTIRGENGGVVHKKLKDYMIAEKIPRHQRESLPLLAQGSHVLWAAGYRISEDCKVSERTKIILEVSLIRDEKERSRNGG